MINPQEFALTILKMSGLEGENIDEKIHNALMVYSKSHKAATLFNKENSKSQTKSNSHSEKSIKAIKGLGL